MNRRDFMTVLGGATMASLAGIRPALASEPTTTLYLNGLVMASFEDPVLRIGFPNAPGHKATLQIVPVNGTRRTIPLKGNGIVQTSAVRTSNLKIDAPELIRISEIYGPNVKSKFGKCPNVIEIPYAAIKSITTSKVTKDRWTFVRADNHQEIDTFRPRQIAEGLKIELLSNGTLNLEGGKTKIALDTTQEISSNYAPDPKDAYPGMYEDHFVHYFQYLDRPPAADFLVVPKKVTGVSSGPTPRVGNRFMMIEGTPVCYIVMIGPSS